MSGTTIDSGLTADSGLLKTLSHPDQVNYLDAVGSANKVAAGVWANREAQAQQAWGDALQQATDLKTGVVDYARANALAAGSPQAAIGMMRGLKGSTELTGATQDQGAQRNAAFTNAISAALRRPDDQLHDGVMEGVQQLVNSGAMTQQQAHRALLNLPSDPGQLRTSLEQRRIALLPPVMQQPAIYDSPGSQTGPGGETVGTRQSVRTGVVSPAQPSGTGVAGGMDAKQLDAPFSYNDPASGQPRTTTLREYMRANNIPVPTIHAPAGDQSGVPASIRNPNRPTSSTPPPAQAGQPASGATGPEPGMAEKWKASAEQYTTDTAAAGQYQQRIFPLVQGHALLQSGDVTTGKGAEYVQGLKGMLGTVAGQFGWNPNAINNAKFEELNKYLTQYTNALPMAGASDARLASAITGNPSAHISTLANKDVVKALIGLERMKQTAITDFAAQGGQPKDYADHLRGWQNTHDPRAFIFDMMEAKDRQKMVAGMTGTERAAFSRTLDQVERNPGIMGQAAMPH